MPYFIYIALASLGTLLTRAIFFVATSFISKSLISTLILIGIAYFAVTKIEAFNLISSYIKQILDSSGVSLSNQTVNISALGQLIKLLRIEDCIFVYLSAIITAFLLRMLISIGKLSKNLIPA